MREVTSSLVLAAVLLAGVAPGGQAQAVDTTVRDLADIADKPALLTHPDLGYKDGSKDAGLTGTDLVKFIIDTAGRVEPGSVPLAAVSDPMLDTLAVHVVRGMKFRPGAVAGAPVRVSVSLPVHFGNGAAPAQPENRVSAESCVDRKPQPLSGDAVQHGSPVGLVPADSMAMPPGSQYAPKRVRGRAVVDTGGQVIEATVEDAGVSAETTQKATAMAKRMRFIPGRLNGTAVRTSVTIPITVTSN